MTVPTGAASCYSSKPIDITMSFRFTTSEGRNNTVWTHSINGYKSVASVVATSAAVDKDSEYLSDIFYPASQGDATSVRDLSFSDGR